VTALALDRPGFVDRVLTDRPRPANAERILAVNRGETAPEDAPEILQESIVLWATSYTLAAQKEQGFELMQQAAQIILRQIEAGQQPMVQQAIQQAREDE